MKRPNWLRRSGLASMLVLIAALPTGGEPEGRGADLQNLLESEVAAFPGRAGIWVKHLTTQEEAGVNADEIFNSASVIKLGVLTLALELVERGTLRLEDRITIRPEDIRGGSGVFRHQDPGLQPTFRDVLLQMVITSDNTATDLAIARVGGVGAVNDWIADRGFEGGMRLTQTTGELFAKYGALPAGADRNRRTTEDRAYWLGEMTPRSTGRLLQAIELGSLGSPASREEMLRMLRAQQAGARRLPHFVGVAVAHKTGDFPPVLANDVGIVYARSGPIVVAVFTNAIVGPYGEAEDRIGRMAQLVVRYFDGA
jgi:beta-lactamase class A